jgi:hypothetical protein
MVGGVAVAVAAGGRLEGAEAGGAAEAEGRGADGAPVAPVAARGRGPVWAAAHGPANSALTAQGQARA